MKYTHKWHAKHVYVHGVYTHILCIHTWHTKYVQIVSVPLILGHILTQCDEERWGAGVETQKNVRGEVGGWGRVPFNEPYAPSLSTIYDGA